MKKPLIALLGLALISLVAAPFSISQQAPGTAYSSFIGAFAAPALSGVGTATLTYTAGTLYQGGASKAITAGTLTSLDASESSCAAPAYSACEFIYWTSGTGLSKSPTFTTAFASGNIVMGFVTTDSMSLILTITPSSLDYASRGNQAAPITLGTPIFYADTGAPTVGTQGTNTTGVANQLWYTQVYVPFTFSVTNAAVLCGGTCSTDKIAIGIWSTAGTLLAWTATTVGGGTTLSGANTWQKIALTAPFVLTGPARYIIGVVTSGTTAGDIQTAPLTGAVCAVASSQGTLASFTPAVTSTTNVCPFAFVN